MASDDWMDKMLKQKEDTIKAEEAQRRAQAKEDAVYAASVDTFVDNIFSSLDATVERWNAKTAAVADKRVTATRTGKHEFHVSADRGGATVAIRVNALQREISVDYTLGSMFAQKSGATGYRIRVGGSTLYLSTPKASSVPEDISQEVLAPLFMKLV